MSRPNTDASKQLRDSIQGQLNRLLTQLRDLEDMKADLEEDEYQQLRGETLDQLKDFEASLERTVGASGGADGPNPLMDDVEKARRAVQETIRSAVASSGAKESFAKKESVALRGRLASLQESLRLGSLSPEVFEIERRSILTALQAMGEQLTDLERGYLTGSSALSSQFVAATDYIDMNAVRK